MALAQLRGRWKMPCIFALIYIVIAGAFCYGVRKNFTFNLVAIAIYGILDVALISISLKLLRPEKNVTFDDFFEGLENWIHAALGMLWFELWVFLWALLFVIPGIVKAISYSMMFWVITENPQIGPQKAMKISKIMTNGHKADIFGMYLSFLGWAILSILSCGIGFVWFVPYIIQTMTNAYYDLKKMAFDTGVLKPADFASVQD